MGATLLGHDAKSSVAAGSATSQTNLAWPTGLHEGDLAFLVGSNLNGTEMLAAGWTPDAAQPFGAGAARLFRKVCDGTETGTTGFTMNGTGSRLAGALFVVSGAGAPAEALVVDNAGPDFTLPSVTPTEDGCLLVAVSAVRHNSVGSPGINPGTSGYTELQDVATTNGSGNICGAWIGSKQLGAGTKDIATPGSLVISSNSAGGGAVTWLFAFPAKATSPGGGSTRPPAPAGYKELRVFTKS